MRAILQPLLLCLCLSIAGSAVSAAEVSGLKSDALDGLKFKGVTGEKGKGEDHEDTISFIDGVFRSLDCEGWGFGSAPYRVEKRGESYHFTATLTSPKRGRLEWQGVIEGDRAEATFRWLHQRWYWDIDRHYWFKGTRLSDQ